MVLLDSHLLNYHGEKFRSIQVGMHFVKPVSCAKNQESAGLLKWKGSEHKKVPNLRTYSSYPIETIVPETSEPLGTLLSLLIGQTQTLLNKFVLIKRTFYSGFQPF